jgi:hypothetical protein
VILQKRSGILRPVVAAAGRRDAQFAPRASTGVPIKKAPPNDGAKAIVERGSAISPTRSRSWANAPELRRRCFLFTTLLKDQTAYHSRRQVLASAVIAASRVAS